MLNSGQSPPDGDGASFSCRTTNPNQARFSTQNPNPPSLVESDFSNSLSFDRMASHSSPLGCPTSSQTPRMTQADMIEFVHTITDEEDIDHVSHLLRFLCLSATNAPPSESLIREAIKRGWSQAVEVVLTKSSYR